MTPVLSVGGGNEAAPVHYSAWWCVGCVAAFGTRAATRTRATPWRADESRRRRSRGKGPTFRIYAGPCSVGFDGWPKFADGNSLGGASDVNRARNFAKGLIALQPDAILAQGTPVTAALHRETQTIPIVSVVVTDPVGDGFVGSRRECSIGTPRFFAFSPGRRAKSCPLRFRGHCSRVSC